MRTRCRGLGFTLIELLVVMAVVALLVSLASPRYFASLDRAKETALLHTLSVTRESIDKYYADTGEYPDALETLVRKRYLRSLPYDPITESTDTWTLVPPQDTAKSGIYDLRSGAEGFGRAGKPFREW